MIRKIEYDYERMNEDNDIELLKRDPDHESCDVLLATIHTHTT